MKLETFKQQVSDFEAYMIQQVTTTNHTLKQAMTYSLSNGGKRVRPLLLLATLQALQTPVQQGYAIATALEFIHTYSLIHDDLPAMDNDDYRRGQLTNHKKFNEATGVVGRKMIERLEESSLPVENLYLMASKRSAGKNMSFRGKDIIVEELNDNSFNKPIDYALFSAGGNTSLKYAPIAEKNGVIVIDNSSAWRMNDDIDLIVPECNVPTLKRKIIANPNCSTIQSVVPLGPLHKAFGLKRVAYTTYQAVSGSGQAGIDDLINGQNGLSPTNYPHPIYNNILPHIDVFDNNGDTKEELKMINETKKILSLNNNTSVTATCVRVPVLNSHSVAINVTFDKATTVEQIREVLQQSPGIIVIDNPQNNEYPMPLFASGKDDVFVGRIRVDHSLPNSFHLWVVSDNIRKGAASNTVQIAELLENMKNR